MANAPLKVPQMPQISELLVLVGRTLLLVPEAALLVVLLCLYLARLGATGVALLTALVVIVFAVRVLALYLARAALNEGRYRDAQALLNVALALHPRSGDALALRGTLALAQGYAEEAEYWLRQAVDLLPGKPSYLCALSCALLDQGRATEAAAAARQALLLDPHSGLAHLYVAEAERALEASAEQVEERLRAGLAVATAPEVIAALQCALASHLLAELRAAEASLALRSAESLLPRCAPGRQAELRFHLAELLAANGQPERAREYFQDVEALDPQSRYAAAAWRAARS